MVFRGFLHRSSASLSTRSARSASCWLIVRGCFSSSFSIPHICLGMRGEDQFVKLGLHGPPVAVLAVLPNEDLPQGGSTD
jgi:hypothetical protein